MPDKSFDAFLDIDPAVRAALKDGGAVVALESTIISHGMPYPQNVETALNVEKIVRNCNAVPATIAVLQGRLKVGLDASEIENLGRAGPEVTKTSRRDIPFAVAGKKDGATTVASTMIIAAMAGLNIIATGGIGGVHRGAARSGAAVRARRRVDGGDGRRRRRVRRRRENERREQRRGVG